MNSTREDQRAPLPDSEEHRELPVRPVTEVEGLDELLEHCLPSFGGAYLRRLWQLLDAAVGEGVPLTLAVAGPVTASGQHHTWLCPLLDTGWFMLVSTTDAVCYHDGHRSLADAREHPFFEVPIAGDDRRLREEQVIRITDIGFDEQVLLSQDRFLTACLRGEEFQRRMTGTQMRQLLGQHYARLERAHDVREGLLALCTRKAIPVFVGAPSDGSVFLNSMKLWALREACGDAYAFELDLHGEVFESCAYHLWGLRESDTRALGTLILGGGVPKNFNLQPEPALSQILGLEDISGFLYDIQITTAPVTDGSLSSCPPSEAVTWGKVDPRHHTRTCESVPGDYSMLMPIVTRALLEKRARLERRAAEIGLDALAEERPEARGYLRERAGYRLFERREELCERLREAVRERADTLRGDGS
ncbi:MAG: deoxyhypusine synthase family protein [Planctomycetota bacterium]|nr:deoxyhypusine synthase family protein [Planctomycetota bacterium]